MHSNEIRNSETQERILNAAVEIITSLGSDRLRILDVAATAHVGAPTIYYYYSNRSRLVAAAQAERLTRILSRDDPLIADLRTAVESLDRAAFVEAARLYDAALWGPESTEAIWQILDIVSSVRHEPLVREVITEVIDAYLLSRLELIRAVQDVGWLDPDFDIAVWVNFYFSSCLGRVVIDLAPSLALDGEQARHSFVLSLSPTYT